MAIKEANGHSAPKPDLRVDAHAPPMKDRSARCENCSAIYKVGGDWKMGDPFKCANCKNGLTVRRCCVRCGKVEYTTRDQPVDEFKCTICKNCPICRETDEDGVMVCAVCNSGVRDPRTGSFVNSHVNEVCQLCGCLSAPNDSMCKKCRREHRSSNAGQWSPAPNEIPQSDALVSVTPDGAAVFNGNMQIATGAARTGEFPGTGVGGMAPANVG